jgi:hypothetical protein
VKFPVRVITEGTEEYRRIFETHMPSYYALRESGAGAKPSRRVKGSAGRRQVKLTREPGEIRGIKFGKGAKPPRVIKWNPAFTNDEAPPEIDGIHIEDHGRKTHKPLEHTDLVALRRLQAERIEAGTPFPVEIFFRNEPRDEVAERLGITRKTLQKQIERFKLEAKAMAENNGFPYVPLTDEQVEDIMERGAAYLLVKLNDWQWHKLDLETHGTVHSAIAAFRREAEFKAVDRKPVWRNPPSKFAQTETLKEVKKRFEKIFKKAYVLQKPGTPAWRGVLSEVVRGQE